MGLLQNAGVLIKVISTAIDDCIALSHGAIDRVEVVTLVSAPALDHVALCIVTDPLASTIGAVSPLASFGFLIDILAGGFLALINRVQPVPSIGSRVIDFLAAAIQADVKLVIENYVKNQDTGVAAEHKSQYQELAYTAVGQQLRDVQVVEEKMFRQDNGSFRYYVCMQLPKAALEAAIEDAIAKDAKLNLEFDRAQFKKIFEEQMAAFSQQ